MSHHYNVDPNKRYDGPSFEEYCISEKKYLPANRDRTPCLTCPLENLCQAGFEEQVRRVVSGEDPSLTKECNLTYKDLAPKKLFEGLSEEQIEFVKMNIPNLERSKK